MLQLKTGWNHYYDVLYSRPFLDEELASEKARGNRKEYSVDE